jgi:hypothetical protein
MNINKTYLTMGGIGVGALAVGATGGFFAAKKYFFGKLDEIIENEVAGTKKYYELRIKQLKEKPETPKEALAQVEKAHAAQAIVAETIAKENGYKRPETPAVAYNRLVREREEGAHKVTAHNIWQDQKEEDREPPKSLRGSDGKFVSPRKALAESDFEELPAVELISLEEFFGDTRSYEQVNLVWFLDGENGTLRRKADDEAVDIEDVGGADVLSILPTTEPDENEKQIIFVRNNAQSVDYEIELSEENLAEAIDASQS